MTAYRMIRQLNIELPKKPTAVNRKTAEILQRELKDRCGKKFEVTLLKRGRSAPGNRTLVLETDARIGKEAFRIADDANGAIHIAGGDDRGLLYGAGKFLRTCRYGKAGLEPGLWRGSSAPEKPVRGMYFATHFHNWYHEAPVKEVARYVEELALWGYNSLAVWFDMHHYTGIDDPAAQKMIERLRAIFKAANAVGLGAALFSLSNEAYEGSPEILRADWTAGHDGYTQDLYHYHVELCPNKPGALALMLKWRKEVLAAFSDIRLDYIGFGPYDQGGCTCPRCKPWGSNGYLKMGEAVARLCRRSCPDAKIILSTWCFDFFTTGEFSGMAKAFRKRPDWVDYLMVDGHNGCPKFILDNGAPGGLPPLGFPEISMYGMSPWGGFGANPFPSRLQEYWDNAAPVLAGGYPYSEGIYEDMNKAICSRFYWGGAVSAAEAVAEYIAYEFSPEVVESVAEAVRIFEETLERRSEGTLEQSRYIIEKPEQIEKAYALIRKADAQLPPRARAGWRWRILFLRAKIDHELLKNNFAISEACDSALQELTDLYHAKTAEGGVCPPTRGNVLASPFVVKWECAPLGTAKGGVSSVAYSTGLLNREWKPVTTDSALPSLVMPAKPNEPRAGVYLFRACVKTTQAIQARLLLGADSPIKLFVNGKRVYQNLSATNPCIPDQYEAPVSLQAGGNEFVAVFDSRNGRGWGLCLRFAPATFAKKFPNGLFDMAYKGRTRRFCRHPTEADNGDGTSRRRKDPC